MNDSIYEDKNVGSVMLEYLCSLPSEMGAVHNCRVLFFKVGDDPNWWMAQRLMPGAVVQGRIAGAISVGDADDDDGVWPTWKCELRVRGSVFRADIPATCLGDALVMCRDIGGIRPVGMKPVSRWEKVGLFLKYYWLRRPRVVRGSPLDQ